MGWNRTMLEAALADAYQAAGTNTFDLEVAASNMSAVIMQLHHLKVLNRITGFDRRVCQVEMEDDDCVRIFGYMPLEE